MAGLTSFVCVCLYTCGSTTPTSTATSTAIFPPTPPHPPLSHSHTQASIADAMRRHHRHDHHKSHHHGGDKFIYTTHSWIVSMFLDCPIGTIDLQCPNATTVAAVKRAIRMGDITWHAHPHNAQYEFYDTSLLAYSFDLTHELDRRFHKPHKHTAILVRPGGVGKWVHGWMGVCQRGETGTSSYTHINTHRQREQLSQLCLLSFLAPTHRFLRP